MLLACDIGNTNIMLGVWRGDELVATFRLHTRADATSDEYISLIGHLLSRHSPPIEGFTGCIISSVVPPLTAELAQTMTRLTGRKCFIVSPGIKTGLNIMYDDPREVGSDRIVNAVAGISLFEPPLIVLDFGTATTFDLITPPANYVGGAIAPGLILSMEALAERTAKLPKVELTPPKSVVGKTTSDSIRSGIIFGHASMVDGLTERIEQEFSVKCKVIATGGLAHLIKKASKRIEHVEPNLTLIGLRILWEKNKDIKD